VLICSVLCKAEERTWSALRSEKESGGQRAVVKWQDRMEHIRRRTSCLQESGLAGKTLDIFGLLVNLQLRLGHFGIFVFAIPL
jgi:hypothetical protein